MNRVPSDSAAFPVLNVAVQQLSAHPTRSAMLLLACVLAIVAGLAGVMQRVSQFRKLDMRVVPAVEGLLVTQVQPKSGAARAGLARGDLIVAVDGKPMASLRDLDEALFKSRVAMLSVIRSGARREVAYYAPPVVVDVRYLLLAFASMFSLLVATVVYLRQPSSHSARFFALASALFPTVAISGEPEAIAQWLLLVRDFGRLFLPPLLVLFFGLFPVVALGPKARVAVFVPSLVVAFAKVLLSLGLLPPVAGGVVVADSLDQLMALLVVLGVAAAVAVAVRVYSRARPDPTRRRQVEWVAAGAAAGFIPYLLLSVIPQLAGAELEVLSWLSLLPLTLVPLGVASSLLEFRLWDLEDVVRHVVATGVAVILGGVAFTLFNLWLTQVGFGLGQFRTVLAAAAGVALVGLAIPVRRALLSAIERLQYRERLAARQALATFAEQSVGISDPQILLRRLGELLFQALGVDQVVLYRISGDTLVSAYPHDGFPSLDPAAISGPFPAPSEGELKRLGIWHRFPMVRGERVLGVAYLGRKRGAMPLTHAERRLVGALLAQAALALENSLLLADLYRQVEQHRLLEEYLERVFESAAAALLICDASGIVLRANQRAQALLGSPEKPLNGSRLGELVALPEAWPRLPERAAGVKVRIPGGSERVGVLSVSTVELQPGQRDGRVVALEDITQQLALEHRLAQQERMAALGRLAAGLAHEVNTPVTGIASYAQLLRELTPSADPRASLVEKIEEQAFRVARIVTNLLELARPAGFERALVDLAAVAREEWLSVRQEAKRSGVSCTCKVPDTLPIRANRVQLELVVHNLLRNALQATPAGGAVEVEVREENGVAVLEVRDTGPGIPEELREAVFEPFVTSRAGQGGTGLGLAITRDIVKAHGGRIEVRSRSPHGTVMHVELPREGEQHAHPHH
ncbi:MAG: ATP-binding protein [Thermoanaerobaculum sp.]